jgi:2-keto-3-deoxy-L-fuconate dehydrogenase
MTRLAGKVALITAAGDGIGRAIAEKFHAEGATVWATDIEPAKLSGLQAAHQDRLDVRSDAEVAALRARIGVVDILVNCAGFVSHGTVLDADEALWEKSFDINVRGMHRTIRAFLPGMLERGGGSIVNIASCASSVRGIRNRYIYGTTKGAVIALTKSVAIDFVHRQVRVNAICPGAVESPSMKGRIAAVAQRLGQPVDAVRKTYTDQQLNGRFVTAEEVACAAVYLASDEAASTTGHIHFVDGGLAL